MLCKEKGGPTMTTKLVLTYELTDLWASPEELAEMTDEQIIELAHEDLCEVTENCAWEVKR